MTIMELLSANLQSFSGTLETSGQTIHTEKGDIALPRSTSVTITKDGSRLVLNFGRPPEAVLMRIMGIPVSAKINPLYIGEDGVTAKIGHRLVKISMEEQ